MNEKRLEMLKKLRNFVAEGKNIETRYCAEGSYCAVGFMLNECGFDFEQPGFTYMENGAHVGTLVAKFDLKGLDELFTVDELQKLQNLNDNDTKDSLLSYIDELIKASDAE